MRPAISTALRPLRSISCALTVPRRTELQRLLLPGEFRELQHLQRVIGLLETLISSIHLQQVK